MVQGWCSDFEQAQASIQRALDINVMANNLWGIAVMKAIRAYMCCYYPGKIDTSLEVSSEALGIAQESGDGVSKGMAHVTYGISCYAKGHFEEAERHLLEGKGLCEKTGMYTWVATACAALAENYFDIKEFQRSRQCYDQLSKFLKRVQTFPSGVQWGQLGMAKCEVMMGERDIDLKSLRAIAEKFRIKVLEGWVSSYLGEIFLNLGGSHLTEAEHWIIKAIEANERNGLRFHLGTNHALYAEFFKCQGNRTRAQDQLGKAIDILRKCGADGWVEKYERELAAIQ